MSKGIKWAVNEAVRTSGLPAPARLIEMILSDLADAATGVIPPDRTPSLRELGEWTGLGKGPVAKHLITLEELGWVARIAPPTHLARTEHARTTYTVSVGKTMERAPRQRKASHDDGHVLQRDMGMSSSGTSPVDNACPPAGHGHVPDEDKSMSSRRTVPYIDKETDVGAETRNTKPKNPATTRRARTTIPDDFTITNHMRVWAAEKCPDVNIDLHTIRFINWHTEKQTSAALWDRAWQNWMAKEQATFASNRPRASPDSPGARYVAAPVQTRPPAWGTE